MDVAIRGMSSDIKYSIFYTFNRVVDNRVNFLFQLTAIAHELTLRYACSDAQFGLLGECECAPLGGCSRELFWQLALALDTCESIDLGPCEAPHALGDRWVCVEGAPIVVYGCIGHWVCDRDLSGL